MAIIEHDFENGLTVRNGTIYADYNKFYRNVYPGRQRRAGLGRRRSGDAGSDAAFLDAYENYTPRENAFNQTDFVYKTVTGPVRHTVAFGTEFGRQTGLSLRNTGQFPQITATRRYVIVNPFNADLFRPGNLQPPSSPLTALAATPTASTGSTSRPAMCRTRSRSRAGCNSCSARVTTVSICRRSTRTPTSCAIGSTRRSRRVRP